VEFNDGSQYREVSNFAAYMAERDIYCCRAASASGSPRTPYVDTAFARHRAGFANIKALCFYQFPYTDAGSPEAQAQFFLDTLGGALRKHEMVMLDPESGGGFTAGNVQDFVRRWLAVVEPTLNTKAWIYVPSALSAGLPRSFTGDRLVMAPRYSGDASHGLEPSWPWDIHQYTDQGYFPGLLASTGVNGDTNHTDLTTDQILARCNPNGQIQPCGSL
jgi:GH25 family lysozyme M1 (1,4-beta-N-acetylmuramidase)